MEQSCPYPSHQHLASARIVLKPVIFQFIMSLSILGSERVRGQDAFYVAVGDVCTISPWLFAGAKSCFVWLGENSSINTIVFLFCF